MSASTATAVTSVINDFIKVLIVDDSPTMQLVLTQMINQQPDMRVIGAASEPMQAREMIKELNPDVLTLDVEMPGMDGISFLEKIMTLRPMPVVMISSVFEEGSAKALRAKELGACELVQKRHLSGREALYSMASEVATKIRKAKKHAWRMPTKNTKAVVGNAFADFVFPENCWIMLGASTGGTEAIKAFLDHMPAHAPAILMAQHMPEGFTTRFASRLNDSCAMTVMEASHHQAVRAGCVYLAPGHSHLLVRRRSGGEVVTELSQGPEVNRHRPAVDVLFKSAAEQLGRKAAGVLLTGMGKDGAEGLLAMHEKGSYTLAQDEASSVVYGMPKAAVLVNAVDEQGTPAELCAKVLTRLASSTN